jgi:RNA polymerase sigma factor (sigma-70 family)
MDRPELDDLAQDVWALLMRELPKWEFDPTLGALDAWIASIASHEAWKRARRRSTYTEQLLDPEFMGTILYPVNRGVSELERQELEEEARAVLAELAARLSPLSNRIFLMGCFDSKSVPQIAAQEGLSLDCVKMRLRRARHLLDEVLRRRGSG